MSVNLHLADALVCISVQQQHTSGGSTWGARGAAAPPDRLVAPPLPPHPITEQLKLWNCCTCLLTFDFAHTLKVVIEELVSGESGRVTGMTEAQITGKLSRIRTY